MDHRSSSSTSRPYSYSDLGVHEFDSDQTDAGACLGVDFGGTLTKIVFFECSNAGQNHCAGDLSNYLLNRAKYGNSGVRDVHLSFHSDHVGGTLHFINFETSHTQGAIRLISGFKHNIQRMQATGGGAFKFGNLLSNELGIKMMKRDELETVVRGIIFTLLEHPQSECYTYSALNDDGLRLQEGIHVDALSCKMKKIPKPLPENVGMTFPFLVVNIGSGVSMIKVESPTSFKRVSGTAIGGATYYGLCKLLCRVKSYGQAMDLAERGDSRDVNLRVQDIYGGSYDAIGLSGEITAAFFGKAAAAKGHVRSRRSNKLPVGLVLEALGLIITALLFANLLVNLQFVQKILELSWMILLREIILLAMPFGVAMYVFRCSGTKLGVLWADSMGKSATETKRESTTLFDEADIARALVVMVAQNVTQIAFLNAKLHQTKRVIFTGNFLRHNKIALRALTSFMHTWSQGEIEALFMEHEGYFGAIGAFLYSFEKNSRTKSIFVSEDEGADDTTYDDTTTQQHQTKAPSHRSIDTASVTSSDDEVNKQSVISELLYRGTFPRRKTTEIVG